MEMILSLLAASLWFIIASLLIIEFAPYTKNLNKIDAATVFFILLFGGPIIAIANVLEAILGSILPEGWNNDDENFKGS